jgi:quinol monooxygenase YgiN
VWFEIRRETAQPGRGRELAQWMVEQVIPLHEANGMTVVGSFTDADDEDAFVWIRRFRDADHRQAVVERAHQDPAFETAVAARVPELLAGEAVTVRLVPTAGSELG